MFAAHMNSYFSLGLHKSIYERHVGFLMFFPQVLITKSMFSSVYSMTPLPFINGLVPVFLNLNLRLDLLWKVLV